MSEKMDETEPMQ